MINLRAHSFEHSLTITEPKLFVINSNPNLPVYLRSKFALLSDELKSKTSGYGLYLHKKGIAGSYQTGENKLVLPPSLHYLESGDVVRVTPAGKIWVIFRKSANYNSILLTERCNHYCLMCSQPPKKKIDNWLLDQAIELAHLVPKDTPAIGFTGGEPTLYGDDLIKLISIYKNFLPHTSIDILTNGRAFSNAAYSKAISSVKHPNCMFAIPLYCDDPDTHDYVVQAKGAFNQTIEGILRLKSLSQLVEIRVVIHQQTIDRLLELCEFIGRNLTFVNHVALMGLEITGFTRANLENLWIDPFNYKEQLSQSVKILEFYGVKVSIYNHQLCIINSDVYSNYVSSISDWKAEYVKECEGCLKKGVCGGFFSSSAQHRFSSHITPFS